jgi:hypothetical protein
MINKAMNLENDFLSKAPDVERNRGSRRMGSLVRKSFMA